LREDIMGGKISATCDYGPCDIEVPAKMSPTKADTVACPETWVAITVNQARSNILSVVAKQYFFHSGRCLRDWVHANTTVEGR
jgi:hypothetical protein